MITLLTDFGTTDPYVGIMKGVITQIHPHVPIVDLTHGIPPQDIAAARFCLRSAYRHFPKGSVHVAVVDPGVGSQRRAVAIQIEEGWLVGPDNGLFGGVLQTSAVLAAVELTNSRYWYTDQPSRTFHGRDLFAPVGAYLAKGVGLSVLGTSISIESLIDLPIPGWTKTDAGFCGSIQYIDHFGNLVTTIPADCVQNHRWKIKIPQASADSLEIPGCLTFSDQQRGEWVALIGSDGWVEIGINQGNAQAQLNLSYGDPVAVILE